MTLRGSIKRLRGIRKLDIISNKNQLSDLLESDLIAHDYADNITDVQYNFTILPHVEFLKLIDNFDSYLDKSNDKYDFSEKTIFGMDLDCLRGCFFCVKVIQKATPNTSKISYLSNSILHSSCITSLESLEKVVHFNNNGNCKYSWHKEDKETFMKHFNMRAFL